MTGVINVYKEKGYTSHDVVAILRRHFRVSEKTGKDTKIGHTGTLDPQAEGVLPVCVGRATKLVDYLTAESKTYKAELILGKTTDTADHTGKVLTTKVVDITAPEIENATACFVGGYMQMPPMYSAIKVHGKRLYQLAREGKTVERKARPVAISRIDITKIDFDNHRLWLEIDCGKGTYIRSLCEDIGEKLGCGGCMGDLVRTRSGAFTLAHALKLSALEALSQNPCQWDFLIPVDQAFPVPKLIVTQYLKTMMNGHSVHHDHVTINENIKEGHFYWLCYGETIIGLYKLEGGMFKLEVMMYENNK